MSDFTGFRFNGKHSSELHIYRTSDGSRYNDNLVPNFNDVTAQIAGGDGMLYWESFYTSRQFTVPIAFDALTEVDYRALRNTFSGKTEGQLIFDEAPYKYYYVKMQNPPQLKTICFNVGGTRIYKGEGTLNFISYYPYARSVYKFLNEYIDEDYPNKLEWSAASKLKATQGTYDGTGTTIHLYNPGDVPTDFCAYFAFNNGTLDLTKINIEDDELQFSGIIKQGSDLYLRINTRTNLIEGCDINYQPTGTLYNKYIISGDFFKIPLSETEQTINLICTGASCVKIEYNYLYY